MNFTKDSTKNISKGFTRGFTKDFTKDFTGERFKNFVEVRMNRDNFWNIIFGVSMSFCLYCTPLFADMTYRRVFIALVFISIPVLIKIKAPVTFTDERDFINSQGEVVTKRFPLGSWIIVSILGGILLAGLALKLSALLAVLSFFLVPVMLFIFKNCPISMLFHSKVYTSGVISDMKLGWKKPVDDDWWERRSLSCSHRARNIYQRSLHINKHHRR